jgi:hypothetical protein
MQRFICGAKPPTPKIPLSSLLQEERLICPSRLGDLPAINKPQIEPQWIHLFQQKAASAKHHTSLTLTECSYRQQPLL